METREVYNVTTPPGPELDALVAEVVSWTGETPAYSTDPAAAMEAWAWLEGNHPWRDADLMLTRYSLTGENAIPSVLVMVTFWDTSIRPVWNMQQGMNFYIPGNDYPHAIALAVVEAGKALGLMVDAPPEM